MNPPFPFSYITPIMPVISKILSKRLTRNILLCILTTVVVFGLFEGAVRFFFLSEATRPFMFKRWYVFNDLYNDDTGFRLYLRWRFKGRGVEPMPRMFDPALGWKNPPSEGNPLGIVTNRGYSVSDFRGRKVALFFGDSFVEGLTPHHSRIPQLLDRSLPDVTVLNFGTIAYGLDQSYLRMMSVVDSFDTPHVIIGLFYNDIDRCVSVLREMPKPYFTTDGDSLVLNTVPIPESMDQWTELFAPEVNSYTFFIVKTLYRKLFTSEWGVRHFFSLHPSESNARRGDKKLLSRKIIELIKEECDRRDLRLTFVVFPYPFHLEHLGWYEPFVREVFNDLDIDYIDIKPILKRYIEVSNMTWSDLYPVSFHPDEKENRVIARYLSREFMKMYGYGWLGDR